MEELDAVAGCEFVDDQLRLARPPDQHLQPAAGAAASSERTLLQENQFRISEVPPGKTYAVTIEGDIGRVEVPLARAVSGW
jgi:hypothetical protein